MIGYIYKLFNKKSNKFYIGSTINPEQRKKTHFNDLKNGKHHSLYLQRAYNIDGSDSFDFEIIKEVECNEENELRKIEEEYINEFWDTGVLYNVSKKGSGGDLVSYHPLSEEIRKKQSLSNKTIWESKTIDEKMAYSEKMKGKNNPNFGNKWSEEQKKKASDRLFDYYQTHDNKIKGKSFEEAYGKERANEIKKKLSYVNSLRTGEKNSFYGKHHTEETKKKLSELHKGKTPSDAKKVMFNGTIYKSAKHCSNALGINYLTVCYRCRNQIFGFSYVQDDYRPREAKERLTLDKCIEVAQKCKTKKEFSVKYNSAYCWLHKNGLMDDIANKYFTEIRHYWSLDEITQIAMKYNSYKEFRENEPNAYSATNRHRWSNKIKSLYQLNNNNGEAK